MRSYTSNSERSSALCDFRWMLRYGLGLEVPSDQYAMGWGKVWHELMEVYWLKGLQPSLDRWKEISSESKIVTMDYDEDLRSVVDVLVKYDEFHRRSIRDNGRLAILAQELPIERATEIGGRWSTASRWFGVVDKVVSDDEGRVWILEHKTTGLHPSKWLEDHRSDYQTRIYAWLLRNVGVEATGCIYDVARRSPSAEVRRNKDGSLRKLRSGTLPKMHSSDWMSGLTPEESVEPWCREIFDGLVERERSGYWFKRESILFLPGEVDRAAAEAHTVATRLRRQRALIEDERRMLYDNMPGCPRQFGDRLSQLIRRMWGYFPRNVGECSRWGRMCEFAPACSEPNEVTCSGLRIRSQTGRIQNESATHRSTHGSLGKSGRKHRAGSP